MLVCARAPGIFAPGVCISARAGATSVLLTYPLDLMRARLAVQRTHLKYDGLFHAFSVAYREEVGPPFSLSLPLPLVPLALFAAVLQSRPRVLSSLFSHTFP